MNTIMNCERVETLLDDYIGNALSAEARQSVSQHLAQCNDCRAMLKQLQDIVSEAAHLPPLSPSRDLWPSIESRLGAQLSLDTESPAVSEVVTNAAHRAFYSRWRMPAAAAALVLVTATFTWQLAKVQNGAGQPSVNTNVPDVALDETPTTDAEWDALAARYVAISTSDVETIYEQEIAALRIIVDEHMADLDSATVSTVRRNLEIIDTAIEDSRKALERDPGSGLLARQLDRALEHKLELLRRVVLL